VIERHARRCLLAAVLATALAAPGCAPVVRYTNALTSDPERTAFTRLPATFGGAVGFVAGFPVDVAAFVPAWFVYTSQPRETRDPLSVFLFPSFVLWKVGVLFGVPFDGVEWLVYRWWQPERVLTQEEREAIERDWDTREYFTEYPVTPIHPPAPAGDGS
jgi:hypothetical protein